MTEQTDQTVWLTQASYDKLAAELADLKGPQRTEVVQRIAAARDEGDLKENGGYHAAREEQGKLEARIVQLEDMLRRAEVGEAPDEDGKVHPGMKVTITFEGDSDQEVFLFGAREMADDTDLDVYSPQSAMGRAVDGAEIGATVSYTAPNGKTFKLTIVSAETHGA